MVMCRRGAQCLMAVVAGRVVLLLEVVGPRAVPSSRADRHLRLRPVWAPHLSLPPQIEWATVVLVVATGGVV